MSVELPRLTRYSCPLKVISYKLEKQALADLGIESLCWKVIIKFKTPLKEWRKLVIYPRTDHIWNIWSKLVIYSSSQEEPSQILHLNRSCCYCPSNAIGLDTGPFHECCGHQCPWKLNQQRWSSLPDLLLDTSGTQPQVRGGWLWLAKPRASASVLPTREVGKLSTWHLQFYDGRKVPHLPKIHNWNNSSIQVQKVGR